MANEILASAFRIWVAEAGVYVAIDCEKTCTLTFTADMVDVSGKCSAFKENVLVKKGATISGSGTLKAGDVGTDAIRDGVMDLTSVPTHVRAYNNQMLIGDVNWTQFVITSTDGGVCEASYDGTFTGTFSFGVDAA